mmetsp:Transcript_9962/g.38869  ORF Transcript_9962/g.38869 Transcript_9962/m.38869 type:complete len:250 (-) Transcript_9962:3956-4705(-)
MPRGKRDIVHLPRLVHLDGDVKRRLQGAEPGPGLRLVRVELVEQRREDIRGGGIGGILLHGAAVGRRRRGKPGGLVILGVDVGFVRVLLPALQPDGVDGEQRERVLGEVDAAVGGDARLGVASVGARSDLLGGWSRGARGVDERVPNLTSLVDLQLQVEALAGDVRVPRSRVRERRRGDVGGGEGKVDARVVVLGVWMLSLDQSHLGLEVLGVGGGGEGDAVAAVVLGDDPHVVFGLARELRAHLAVCG